MREPRRLTTLWAFTACYRDSFNFFPEGERPIGRPRRKQEDDINWRLKMWIGFFWLGRKGPCGSRVNTIMHLGVSRKAENFLRMDCEVLKKEFLKLFI
jgi:hypothetical protein